MSAAWSEVLVASMLIASGALVLAAGLGLLLLPDFFLRMHAPALASTLGTWLVAFASIVHFSVHEGEVSLRVWLISVLLSITAPVTVMLIARAALFRRRQAGDPLLAPFAGRR
jgi:multicomponent K+:H+ antiporter subunit G